MNPLPEPLSYTLDGKTYTLPMYYNIAPMPLVPAPKKVKLNCGLVAEILAEGRGVKKMRLVYDENLVTVPELKIPKMKSAIVGVKYVNGYGEELEVLKIDDDGRSYWLNRRHHTLFSLLPGSFDTISRRYVVGESVHLTCNLTATVLDVSATTCKLSLEIYHPLFAGHFLAEAASPAPKVVALCPDAPSVCWSHLTVDRFLDSCFTSDRCMPDGFAKKFGGKCKRKSDAKGLQVYRVKDATFGYVGAYDLKLMNELLREVLMAGVGS